MCKKFNYNYYFKLKIIVRIVSSTRAGGKKLSCAIGECNNDNMIIAYLLIGLVFGSLFTLILIKL